MKLNAVNRPAYSEYSDKSYNRSPEGKKRRTRYRHDNSKYITDAVYLSRKFVAIDSEGVNLTDGSHMTIMLAISDQKPLIDINGLTTKRMLDYLYLHLDPKDINVFYGGSYDFNMILKGKGTFGVDEEVLRQIYTGNYLSKGAKVYNYRIKWVRGKSFSIIGTHKTIEINDVVSFFQCPFIQACDQYLGEYEGREELVREKAKRGNFTVEEVDSIDHYNQLELRLLVRLCNELRERANRVHLRPRRWNSPGAIAASLFTREHVKDALNKNIPAPVAKAARFAYAGGRFEMLKYGAVNAPVYEYDINSAYPAALTKVPNLANGHWIRHDGYMKAEFCVYHVVFDSDVSNSNLPGPLFRRGSNGTVSFPLSVKTWCWTPEMESLKKYCEQISETTYRVIECWEYVPAPGDKKPFAFVNKLYAERQNLKAVGDGAHVAIKLALNSLYGKLAQQVGWVKATEEHPVRTPPYHQLEWAGYVTSWCRSKVLEAALLKPESVIAFETDALFTTEPLDLPIGPGLGAWEVTEFASLTYVQSGHYYGTLADGKEVIRCRGVDKGFIDRDAVERELNQPTEYRYLEAQLTRFYGAGIALARGVKDYWCKWITEPKVLKLFPTGKRVHLHCPACTDEPFQLGVWHETICPIPGGQSYEYPVAWINPNADMNELEEMRSAEPWDDID